MEEPIERDNSQLKVTRETNGTGTYDDRLDVTHDANDNTYLKDDSVNTTVTRLQLTPVRVAPAIPSTFESSSNQNETLYTNNNNSIASRVKQNPSFQSSGKSYSSHNYQSLNNRQQQIHNHQDSIVDDTEEKTRARTVTTTSVTKSSTSGNHFSGGGRRLSQQAERAVVSFIRSSQSEVASHNTPLVRSNSFTLQDLDRARKSIQASLEADDFDITGLPDDATYRYFHSLSPASAMKARRFSKSLPELYHNNLKRFPVHPTGMREEYNYFGRPYMDNGDDLDDDDDDDACSSSTRDIPDSTAWRGKGDFYFTAMSLACGLNAMVRFPYFAYKFHAGSFLFAFAICSFFIALPILTIEYALGQLTRRGPISAFGSLCPLLRGVPVAAAIVSLLSSFVYSAINSWSLFYFFKSFYTVPLWSKCKNDWNSGDCHKFGNMTVLAEDFSSLAFINSSALSDTTTITSIARHLTRNVTAPSTVTESIDYDHTTEDGFSNATRGPLDDVDISSITKAIYNASVTPSQEFFDRRLLELKTDTSLLDSIAWELIIFVLVSWIFAFISLRKKILFSARPSSCLALVPYAILTVLFVRALILPGSKIGIFYFFKPKLLELMNPSLWSHAAAISLHTLGCLFGISFAKATCNRERNNFLVDAFLVTIINLGTLILIGVIVFATLGSLADKRNVDIQAVVVNDFGVAFVAFSELLSSISIASFWSVLFFFALFSLGLDYQISIVRAFLVSIEDAYGTSVKRNFLAHQIFTLILCLFSFLASLIFLTPQGLLLIQLFDQYITVILTLVLAFFEVILMAWFYGGSNLAQVIRLKLSKRLGYYLPCCWTVMTPLSLLSILACNAIYYREPLFRNHADYPLLMHVSIVSLVIILLLLIPLIGCHQINRISRGSFFNRLMASCKPVQREMPNIPLVTECDDDTFPPKTIRHAGATATATANQSVPMNYLSQNQYSTGNNATYESNVPLNHIIHSQAISSPSHMINSTVDCATRVRRNHHHTDARVHPIHVPVTTMNTYNANVVNITLANSDNVAESLRHASEMIRPSHNSLNMHNETTNNEANNVETFITIDGHNNDSKLLDTSSSHIISVPVTFALMQKLDRETDL